MGFGFKQPLVGEKRCVTTLFTAAEGASGERRREDWGGTQERPREN